MDQTEEARQSLLVYLQSNRTFIEEKLYNEFNVECIEGRTLQTLNVEKMAKTIREIFDFGTNPVYSYFFSRLTYNIKQYIAGQYSSKAIPSFFVLDIDKLTDILKHCITHGFDENARRQNAERKRKEQEALKEQKQIKEIPQQPKSQSMQPSAAPVVKETPRERPKVVFVEQVKKVQPPKDEFAHIKSKLSTFLDPSMIPEKKEFKLEKYAMPELNVMPRYLAALQKSPPKEQPEPEPEIQVAALDVEYIETHKRTMLERLEKLFNFYCYQQQSLGQGPTFDRMKDQGQLMNLGKFMQFCQYTNLFPKHISKEQLMAQYKRQAEGKLEITFEIFERIIVKLDQQYLSAMGHDPMSNPLPTYQARLRLNEPGKLGELKKQRNLVFGTRSKQGRQVKEWAETERYPKKELTLHSGRFSNDLSIDRKEKQQAPKTERKAKPKLTEAVIQLSDLKKLKLPKINWIVEEQEEGAARQRRDRQAV